MTITFVLIAAAVALYYITVNPFRFWVNKGVKCLTAPNLWGAIKGSFLLSQDELYTFAPGEPYVGITTLSGPVVSVRDPDLIKVILSNEANCFIDRGMPSLGAKRDPLAKNAFLTDGPTWKYLHAKLTPAMSPLKQRGIFDIAKETVDHMINILSRSADKDEVVDLDNMIRRCTAEILFSLAFGGFGNILTEPHNMFFKMLRTHFKATSFRSFYMNLLLSFPWIANIIPPEMGRASVISFFLEPFLASLEERKKSGLKKNDYIDYLLEIQNSEIERSKTGGEDVEFTDQLIAATTWGFFAAGSESSGHVTTGALIELANHSDVQSRARKEVKDAISKYGGLTYDAIKNMPYMDQVILEALRMYPTAKTLKRRTTKKFRMPDGRVTLPARTRILINVARLHDDPAHYPEPHKFDPERFAPERQSERGKYLMLSFGEGPRKCFGYPMALNQLKLILGSILCRFELRPKPGVPYPPEMSTDTIFHSFKHGAPVYLTRI